MTDTADNSTPQGRAGFCAILGLPNVGKSTLLNRLLGMRLVAVSPKPQTTRNRILGVLNTKIESGEPAQIVFVDTPGTQRGKGALRRYMHEQAMAAAGDCDVALHVVDVTDSRQTDPKHSRHPQIEALHEALAAVKVPVVLVLNNVDRLPDKSKLFVRAEGRRHQARSERNRL
jgi:GTP-binding protein Era